MEASDRLTGAHLLADLEPLLDLLGDFQDLIRYDRLACDQKLMVIDRATVLALSGPPDAARDLVRDVRLGRIEP